jgi:hypothetical protein
MQKPLNMGVEIDLLIECAKLPSVPNGVFWTSKTGAVSLEKIDGKVFLIGKVFGCIASGD